MSRVGRSPPPVADPGCVAERNAQHVRPLHTSEEPPCTDPNRGITDARSEPYPSRSLARVAEPLRALFYNEGTVGTGILGHSMLERALRAGLSHRDDVDAYMLGPAPEGRIARLAARSVPGLFGLSLDFQPTRWHLVQSLRARRAILGSREAQIADVLYVNTQASALLLGSTLDRVPTFLSVDASIEAFTGLEAWQQVRPWTHATLLPSLALERRVLERAARVLAWTPWAADSVRRAAPKARVTTLHPGLDLERFAPRPRMERSRTRVLFVGARFESKGGADLLAALGPDLGNRCELDVVSQEAPPAGEGVSWHQLSPGDDRLIELYQQADIFCLPSHADTFGWAILEALACGTPVVASDVGGIPDLVDDAGIVVPRGDRRALRAALGGLIDDPTRRAALGRQARARAERCFNNRQQTSRLIDAMRAAVS
jgi:Glycosyl transferases group 1